MTLILLGLSRAVEVENQDWGDAKMAKSGRVYKSRHARLLKPSSVHCLHLEMVGVILNIIGLYCLLLAAVWNLP